MVFWQSLERRLSFTDGVERTTLRLPSGGLPSGGSPHHEQPTDRITATWSASVGMHGTQTS
jgi:hypothetical protein